MSLISTKFAQFLEHARRAPYTTGALASLPLAAVIMLFSIFFDYFAIAWFFFFAAVAQLFATDKTPLRKMIWTALFLGTFVPVSIWCWMIMKPA